MVFVKKLITILISIFFLFGISMQVEAGEFTPTINIERTIIDNNIYVMLGYKGENVLALSQSLSYDEDMLSLVAITPLENFSLTKSKEYAKEELKKVNILVDSNISYTDIDFVILTFSLTPKFQVGKQAKLFFQEYEAAGPEKKLLKIMVM